MICGRYTSYCTTVRDVHTCNYRGSLSACYVIRETNHFVFATRNECVAIGRLVYCRCGARRKLFFFSLRTSARCLFEGSFYTCPLYVVLVEIRKGFQNFGTTAYSENSYHLYLFAKRARSSCSKSDHADGFLLQHFAEGHLSSTKLRPDVYLQQNKQVQGQVYGTILSN